MTLQLNDLLKQNKSLNLKVEQNSYLKNHNICIPKESIVNQSDMNLENKLYSQEPKTSNKRL